jgi:hypothetical protein
VAKLAGLHRPQATTKGLLVRPTTKLAVTSCLLLALVLSGVASGATRSAPPKKWVGVFCTSIFTWEKTVKSETTNLKTTITKLKKGGSVDLGAARTQLAGYLGKVVVSTDTLVHKLKATGAPAVPNGSKLQALLLKGIGQIRTAFANGQKAARSLSTSNRAAFARGAENIGTAITAAGNQSQAVLSGLAKYDSNALETAFKGDKTCAKLGG